MIDHTTRFIAALDATVQDEETIVGFDPDAEAGELARTFIYAHLSWDEDCCGLRSMLTTDEIRTIYAAVVERFDARRSQDDDLKRRTIMFYNNDIERDGLTATTADGHVGPIQHLVGLVLAILWTARDDLFARWNAEAQAEQWAEIQSEAILSGMSPGDARFLADREVGRPKPFWA